MLIVIEGIDGAGTTTQAERLCERLRADGISCHLTREPSDGPVGRLLREILAGRHEPTDATTHSLLFAADRADHVFREVEPAIARGEVVISDRWYHSSLAYQGTGEERAWIWQLNQRAPKPDLTIFLEVDPEVAARRRSDAGRDDELFDAIESQRRVAAGYRATIEMLGDGERIEVVDGEQPPDQVANRIADLSRSVLSARDD